MEDYVIGGGKNEVRSQKEDVREDDLNLNDNLNRNGNVQGTKKKRWVKRFHAFGLYLYFGNVRMKRRPRRDWVEGIHRDRIVENKERLYERQEHRCAMCGEEQSFGRIEIHHYLPVARYPELHCSIRNMVLLCHYCHKEVHINPWKQIKMMQEKAEEMGLELRERYAM